MRFGRLAIISAISAVFLFVAIAFAALEVNKPAPQLMLRDISGKMVYLADYMGIRCPPAKRKNVLVHFFSTTCKPCEQEIPALKRLTEQFPEEGFIILMVSVADSDEAAANYFNQKGVKALCLLDKFGATAARWGLAETKNNSTTFSLPYNFLVDKNGVLRAVFAGAHPNIDELVAARINQFK